MRTILGTLLFAATTTAGAAGFTLRVDAAGPDGMVAKRFVYRGSGCTGENVSPALHWEGVPAGAKSLALTVFDPDTPSPGGWWHWLVIDLPTASSGLAQGTELPAGAQSLRNDYGETGWGGPCPPKGDKPHRYVFTLHALDAAHLDLPSDASPAKAGAAIEQHTIGKAQVTLRYGR